MRKISTKTPVRNSGLHIFTAYPQLSKPNRLVPERMVSTIVFVISGELFHDFFLLHVKVLMVLSCHLKNKARVVLEITWLSAGQTPPTWTLYYFSVVVLQHHDQGTSRGKSLF